MRVSIKILVIVFLAILALGMTSIFSMMIFLPDEYHQPLNNPLHAVQGRRHSHRKGFELQRLEDLPEALRQEIKASRDLKFAEQQAAQQAAQRAAQRAAHEAQQAAHAAQQAAKVKPVSTNIRIANKLNNPRYFMVFSTSCSPFQNWQGLAFFHFAKWVNQPGNVTRLVSGCTDEQADALRKVHDEIVRPLSDRFHLHVTPDYSVKDNQKYWNKPHGLLDYLEKVLGFPDKAAEYENDVVIIVDPDMMLLRPITHEFGDYHIKKWAGQFEIDDKVVRHGRPIAQKYGFGASWLTSLKGNLDKVVGLDSPALNVTVREAGKYYPAGPPYLASGRDMYQIAKHWVKFLPRVHEFFPEFMAEMHAYSVAAAHLGLPHQLNEGFMVSDVSSRNPSKGEGFEFLNHTARADACPSLDSIPKHQLPLVLHYCQRYALGRWFFSKYKLREDFFECEAPLMREPPHNVAEIYDWMIFPNGNDMQDFSDPSFLPSIIVNGYMLCTVIFALNQVATEIKKAHCGDNANYEKTFHFHQADAFQAMIDDPSNPFAKK